MVNSPNIQELGHIGGESTQFSGAWSYQWRKPKIFRSVDIYKKIFHSYVKNTICKILSGALKYIQCLSNYMQMSGSLNIEMQQRKLLWSPFRQIFLSFNFQTQFFPFFIVDICCKSIAITSKVFDITTKVEEINTYF